MQAITKKIALDDVVGLQQQKQQIYNSLILPLKEKELYAKLVKCPEKIKTRKHFLFYGPPGTGKTLLAKAIAVEYNVPFTFVQSTQFLNQFVGAGSESMRKLYSNYNGIVFIDEVDIIARKRSAGNNDKTDDILTQLLLVLDGANTDYDSSTIMATNNYDLLDEALLSRIPKSNQLYFPSPNAEQRKLILEKQLTYHNHKINSIEPIINLTNDFNGRTLEDLIAYARISALNDKRDHLLMNDFQKYFEQVKINDSN